MTYRHVVVNDRPDGAWSLDSVPFDDLSGNDRAGTGPRMYNYAIDSTLSTNLAMSHMGGGPATVRNRAEREGEGYLSTYTILTTAGGAGGVGTALAVPINTASSRTITAGFWVRTDVSNTLSLYAEWAPSGGGYGGSSPNSGNVTSVAGNTAWQFIKGTFVIPAGVTNLRLGPIFHTSAAGQSFLIGGYIIVEGSTLDQNNIVRSSLYNTKKYTGPIGSATFIYAPSTPARPLVANTGPAVLVTPAKLLEFDADVMSPGNETGSYTLEAWFKPVGTPAPITVLGRRVGDGLTFDGEAIRFSTAYTAGGNAEVVYYPDDIDRAHHVVGIHTPLSNQLWVNGELRAETPIGADQSNFDTSSSEGFLVSGFSSNSAASAIVDFPAVYRYALTGAQIVNHYNMGRRTDDYIALLGNKNAEFWTLDDTSTVFARTDEFKVTEDWALGQSTDVSIVDGTLQASLGVDNLTLPGEWLFGYGIGHLDTIAASRITWDGDGQFEVAFTTDDVTWTPCVNGQELPGLTDEHDSIGIRVTFTAGLSSDTVNRLRYLRIDLYHDITMTGSRGGRYIQWFDEVAPASSVFLPIEQSDTGRLRTYGGYGRITASSIPNGNEAIGAVEVWVKPLTLGAGEKTLVDFRTSNTDAARLWWNGTAWEYQNCTVYINGAVATSSFLSIPLHEWTHVVVVPDTISSNAVTLLSDYLDAFPLATRLGLVAVYPAGLSASDVSEIYNAYLSFLSASVFDESQVTVTQPGAGVKVYSRNWTVQTVA